MRRRFKRFKRRRFIGKSLKSFKRYRRAKPLNYATATRGGYRMSI